MARQIKLIGGPLSGRSIELGNAQTGDIVHIPSAKASAGRVTIETKHGYRITEHATEGVIGAWINPLDHRRHYGH